MKTEELFEDRWVVDQWTTRQIARTVNEVKKSKIVLNWQDFYDSYEGALEDRVLVALDTKGVDIRPDAVRKLVRQIAQKQSLTQKKQARVSPWQVATFRPDLALKQAGTGKELIALKRQEAK